MTGQIFDLFRTHQQYFKRIQLPAERFLKVRGRTEPLRAIFTYPIPRVDSFLNQEKIVHRNTTAVCINKRKNVQWVYMEKLCDVMGYHMLCWKYSNEVISCHPL